ncbi:hypothetical protein OFY01_14575 [Streptomyces sp. GXMU-J5]|uniref:Lipoprotein n=1 Tax=Streptomyces beihaiensis TaxID=2984495 RepID=A0ABT3TV85_9ACTN|nr:hypothetical protein [Streptomyces beihaiensis]MCX3060962.1 hypothetical protein [Streptomyces beihaiensis]
MTGCGASGDAHQDTRQPAAASGPLTDQEAAGVPGTPAGTASATPRPSGTPGARKTGQAMLPDAELTPVTGSFTARQKKYLHGRVPKNMDPAAVLQTGQEACQRITRTAAHDKDAAVGAIITGEVPGAADAIPTLCPKQKPLLAVAKTGFPDGTRTRPEPGTYRALTSSLNCTWRALDADGKVLASGPGPGGARKVTAKVPSGTRTFVSSGCYAWLPA